MVFLPRSFVPGYKRIPTRRTNTRFTYKRVRRKECEVDLESVPGSGRFCGKAETGVWEQRKVEGSPPLACCSPARSEHNGRDFTQGQVGDDVNEWFNSRLGIILFRTSIEYSVCPIRSFVRRESICIRSFAEWLQVHWSGYASGNRLWRGFCDAFLTHVLRARWSSKWSAGNETPFVEGTIWKKKMQFYLP